MIKKIIDLLNNIAYYIGICVIGIICSLPIIIALAPLVYELTIGGFYSK